MADIRIINGRQVRPEKRVVMRLLGGRPGSAAWQKAGRIYEEHLLEIRRLIRPRAAFALGRHNDCLWLYVMLTLGGAVSRRIEQLGSSCELDTALFLSTMADACLFAFERELEPALRAFCTEQHCGLSARYDAGTDVPLSVQQEAYTLLDAKRTLGLELTADGMLVPEKSLCFVCAVSDDPDVFHIEHNCSRCQQAHCLLRQPAETKSSQHGETGPVRYTCPAGQLLLTFLQSRQASLAALCGGKGTCGRCRVRITAGHVPVSAADRNVFTEAELAGGWRLACQAVPAEPVQVEVPAVQKENVAGLGIAVSAGDDRQGQLGVAIDLGTTTVAAALVSLNGNGVLASASTVNRQRRFGADVISRIQAACHGQEQALQHLAAGSIRDCLSQMVSGDQAVWSRVSRIALAGNTTMEHLLMNWSCQGLGTWPFQPVSLGGCMVPAAPVLGSGFADACSLRLLPGMSAYIGADITAGLLACSMDRTEKLTLFLDLGTNGEMALGSCHGFLTASTAAGPALEGGNIQYGMSSVPGAICHATAGPKGLAVETIGHKPPCGLCGTGIIEVLAALVEQQIVDRHGTLSQPYFASGFGVARSQSGEDIVLTQADIRQVQMAKSAIRSGIDILLRRYGASAADVQQVYLAGSFGYYLNPERAAVIGLLPAECVPRTTGAGNTALAGAVQTLTDEQAIDRMETLRHKAEEVILGNDPSFQDLYIKNMDFD